MSNSEAMHMCGANIQTVFVQSKVDKTRSENTFG